MEASECSVGIKRCAAKDKYKCMQKKNEEEKKHLFTVGGNEVMQQVLTAFKEIYKGFTGVF